mmetsp:Transcript_34885/g.74408  ORF Transcript_34885/g.74408 Transcript_34885/m.74408 type:complete len:311 (+) Transcript_34885:61-993(+)
MKLASVISLLAAATVPTNAKPGQSSGAKGGRLRALYDDAGVADLASSLSMSMAGIHGGSNAYSKSSKAAPRTPISAAGPVPLAPFCPATGAECSSEHLLKGVGPSERYVYSDTLDGCADGTSGVYLEDESVEEITVSPVGRGGELRAGGEASVSVVVHAWSVNDVARFYYAEHVSTMFAPRWVSIEGSARSPTKRGLQTLDEVRFTLPSPGIHAVRVVFGFQYPEDQPCFPQDPEVYDYDDFDDLVITVGEGSGGGLSAAATTSSIMAHNVTAAPVLGSNVCGSLNNMRCGRAVGVCQWAGEACVPKEEV